MQMSTLYYPYHSYSSSENLPLRHPQRTLQFKQFHGRHFNPQTRAAFMQFLCPDAPYKHFGVSLEAKDQGLEDAWGEEKPLSEAMMNTEEKGLHNEEEEYYEEEIYEQEDGQDDYYEGEAREEKYYNEKTEEVHEDIGMDFQFELTPEMIAMFEFSENHRRKLAAAKQRDAEDVHGNEQEWKEAGVDTLVLSPVGEGDTGTIAGNMARILNSHYEESVKEGNVVFWPVLPLRL